jgi:large subunit ribosomal protein L31e
MEKRIHTIPLRKEFNKVSKWRRSKKAVTALRDYVKKHYRMDSVVIGKELNEKIWSRGNKKPPARVKVVALKKDDKVFLYLEEKYKEPEKEEEKKKKEEDKTVKKEK